MRLGHNLCIKLKLFHHALGANFGPRLVLTVSTSSAVAFQASSLTCGSWTKCVIASIQISRDWIGLAVVNWSINSAYFNFRSQLRRAHKHPRKRRTRGRHFAHGTLWWCKGQLFQCQWTVVRNFQSDGLFPKNPDHVHPPLCDFRDPWVRDWRTAGISNKVRELRWQRVCAYSDVFYTNSHNGN